MADIENPQSKPVEGEHPLFGSCADGCRVFDAGVSAGFYELGDVTNHGRFKVAALNGSSVLLELICEACKSYGDGLAPNHSGSQYCKSGSLASGGNQSHCSCDTCF